VTKVVDTDEHPRPDTTLESLAALRPVMGRKDPDATVTAGNSSQQNDGAAVCIVTTRAGGRARPDADGPRRTWAVAGCDPRTHGHRSGAGDRQGARSRAGLTTGATST
jgi:acetyl-CoA C-acetyltransferase